MNHLRLTLLITTFVISACATPYKLSDNALSLRSTMSRAEALAIVQKQLIPDASHAGLCGMGYPISEELTPGNWPSKLQSVVNDTITYTGKAARVTGTSASGSMQYGTYRMSTEYLLIDAQFQMMLTDLRYIAVQKNVEIIDQKKLRPAYRPCPLGTLVVLYNGKVPSPLIHVAPDELDAFIAAITLLSPEATLRPGASGLIW